MTCRISRVTPPVATMATSCQYHSWPRNDHAQKGSAMKNNTMAASWIMRGESRGGSRGGGDRGGTGGGAGAEDTCGPARPGRGGWPGCGANKMMATAPRQIETMKKYPTTTRARRI